MISYEITDVKERINKGEILAQIFVKLETDEIKSTSFIIEIPLDLEKETKEFIESEIKKKIEHIRNVERKKSEKQIEINLLKKQFINTKGQL